MLLLLFLAYARARTNAPHHPPTPRPHVVLEIRDSYGLVVRLELILAGVVNELLVVRNTARSKEVRAPSGDHVTELSSANSSTTTTRYNLLSSDNHDTLR